MKKSTKQSSKRKLLVSMLAVCVLAGHALQTKASEISGITGNDGIFNINPDSMHGDTGFRQYEKFNLSEGDIANLIFKYGEENVSKFVNLVDNTININGILNTMRDGQFYNGKAIFISPNGMVVGASGVLNVGSLSVYTPTTNDYNKYKENPNLGYYKMDQGNADITINGKVLARDGVEISGRNVAIGAAGGIMSGIDNTQVLTSKAQADNLFNNLVNTSAITNARAFEAKDGKIVIKSASPDGSVAIDGTVKNFGEGNINISNAGSKGLTINGTVENKGNSLIVNNKGYLNINGKVRSANRINVTNHGNTLNINGTIHNDNVLKVWNTGEGGTNLNGKIVNKNSAVVQNDKGAFNIGANIKNDEKMDLISNGSGMNVTEDAVIENNGSLRAWNKGEEGIKIAGTVNNNHKAVFQNYKGAMDISGNINNKNTLNIINNGSELNITETAKINNEGYTGILNTGSEGTKFNGTLNNTKGNTILTNKSGKVSIGGTIANAKDAKVNVTNHGTSLEFAQNSNVENNGTLKVWNTGAQGSTYNGTITNNGSAVLQNNNGNLTVSGKINNGEKASMRVSNLGGSLILSETSNVNNKGSLTLQNTGANGAAISGSIDNSGSLLVSNQKGELVIASNIKNDGKTSIVSKEGINVFENASIENNNSFTMLNTGDAGINMAGKITNNGSAIITNKGGNLSIIGTVDNQSGKMNIVNQSGNMYITESGKVNNSGNLSVWSTGSEGTEIAGTVSNSKGTVLIKNDTGKMKVTGKVENLENGKTTIINNGKAFDVADTAKFENNGTLSLVNNSQDGFAFNGNLDTSGTAYFNNTAGDLNINGTITGVDNKLAITSQSGLTIGENADIDNAGTMTMLNNGEKGLTVLGSVKNNGRTLLTNNAGDFTVSGTIANEGDKINLTNHGNAINVTETGKVTSDGVLKVWNTGEGGMNVDGAIENTSSNSAIQSDAGSMNINGTISNNSDKLYITNHGTDLKITENANISNKGNVAIWNTADNKAEVTGSVTSTEGKVIITNKK